MRQAQTKIICDFDGTVTPVDTTDALLGRFAVPEWEDVEKEWLAGEITSRECMGRQIAMIRAERRELDAFIDKFELAPGFRDFAEFCEQGNVDLCIVSDGMDYTIRRVLINHGLPNVPVFANHLTFGKGGYELTFPFARDGCAFGMCKCMVADADNAKAILIGDSHSDTCIAERAAAVYAARGKPLEMHCRKNGIEHTLFDDFFDILTHMKRSFCQ